MDRKPFFCLALGASLFFLTACGNPPAETAAADTETTEAEATPAASAWDQQMEAYHDVMSGTFHPAEEGNFAPLKERYAELAAQAKAWSAVAIPEKHVGKGLEAMMAQLETESAAIGQKVQTGASEEELNEAIVALHDVFHGIVGACQDEH